LSAIKGHEPSIEIDHAEETLQLHLRRWDRHIGDGLNPRGQGRDAGGRDEVAQVVELRLAEQALACVDDKAVGGKQAENLAQVVRIFFGGQAGHKDVVQVDEDKDDAAQHSVHQTLECLRRVL
jgi:hypothetical protein